MSCARGRASTRTRWRWWRRSWWSLKSWCTLLTNRTNWTRWSWQTLWTSGSLWAVITLWSYLRSRPSWWSNGTLGSWYTCCSWRAVWSLETDLTLNTWLPSWRKWIVIKYLGRWRRWYRWCTASRCTYRLTIIWASRWTN